jgi:hypothetical protein
MVPMIDPLEPPYDTPHLLVAMLGGHTYRMRVERDDVRGEPVWCWTGDHNMLRVVGGAYDGPLSDAARQAMVRAWWDDRRQVG